MKTKIHPEYNTNVKVTCSCGNTFVTGSTIKEIQTETCSACHPFYTGKQKLIDSSGILQRFKKRAEKTASMKSKSKAKKSKA